MRCPSCSSRFEKRDLSSQGFVAVEYCPACHGCWLDVPALEGTLHGVWTDLDAMGVTVAETFSDVSCPHCAARMVTVNPQGDAAEVASYVVVANVLLNLDETVTKE